MGAVLLLALIVLVAVNLVFTVRIWKAGVRMGASRRAFTIPRGVDMDRKVKDSQRAETDIDMAALVASVQGAIDVQAEEAGEEVPELCEEDIKKATEAVLASLGRK